MPKKDKKKAKKFWETPEYTARVEARKEKLRRGDKLRRGRRQKRRKK
jgi:hypothetical protein